MGSGSVRSGEESARDSDREWRKKTQMKHIGKRFCVGQHLTATADIGSPTGVPSREGLEEGPWGLFEENLRVQMEANMRSGPERKVSIGKLEALGDS